MTEVEAVLTAAEESAANHHARNARLGRWLCLAGAVVGALGLLGAILDADLLTSVLSDEPPMMPNTAIGLVLIGAAGALRAREGAGRRRTTLSLLAALVVFTIGIGTLAEYVFSTDLKIDQIVAHGPRPDSHPGRPAPATASLFVLLSVALALIDYRPRARARPSEWLIVCVAFVALTSLLGFAFRAELLYRSAHSPRVGVALPTGIALLLISVGLLLERPAAGIMRAITSPGPGGMQFRRLALPAVLIPVVLGLIVTFRLGVVGQHELALVVAVLVSMTIAVGLLGLAMTAVPLNRVHAALDANRAHTRALVEQAPDGVFVADLAGQYLDVNNAGCRMLGYTREELVGKAIADVIPPADVERLERTKEKLLEGGTSVTEWSLRRKDGNYIPVEVSAKIFADGRWQGLVRDISERKRLEGELRAAEAEQKFLAELGSALASTIDYDETVRVAAGLIADRVTDACSIETLEEDGRMHARVFAHRDPAKAPLCRRFEALKLDRARPHLGARVRATLRPILISQVTPAFLEGFSQNVEHRRALDELDAKSFMALPLMAHGGVVGSLVFVSTTPDRHFVESDLPFAERVAAHTALAIEKSRLYRIAQEAIGMRDDVLSVVAHDLRNPLGTILLQVGLMRRRDVVREAGNRRPADVIERAATRMKHLIQDLLDVARMEGGRLTIERTRLPTYAVLVDVIQAHEALAASATLDLRLDASADLPEVWADRERFLQVFENLIGNAIKFSAPGGRIEVGAIPREEDVLFWVKDTGIGIAAADLPHVFERLWQASSGGRHGAGLGLPIVKGIVDAHGGGVSVESTPGAGSTFYFSVPIAAGRDSWRPEPAPHHA